LLGLIIALVFAWFKPLDLFSIESIVSVFGAYTIGKELWDDIERMLTELSKGWRICYRDSYYQYKLEKHTTLTYYSYLAKRQRYGKSCWLPEQIDFIKQSNSQTVRMCFDMADWEEVSDPLVHILSIHIDPALLERFRGQGFLFGVKLSLNKKTLGVTKKFELFQSLDKDARGCLDEEGQWFSNAAFYRRTLTVGRLKYFAAEGVLDGRTIIALS